MRADPHRWLAELWGNGGRWKLLGGALVASTIWAASVLTFVLLQPEPYDPFGDYPIQEVRAPREVINVPNAGGTLTEVTMPVLRVSQDNWPLLPVQGVKCLNSNVPIKVSGAFRWRSVEPPGLSSMESYGTRDAVPGCTPFSFQNPVPPRVREQVEALAMQGQMVSIWQVQGEETPQEGGVTKHWQSENFAIVWEVR